jgi:hypothetical protein
MALWSATESLMYIGGKSVAEIRHLVNFAKTCEEASHKYIRPRLSPNRYPILAVLAAVEKSPRAAGEDLSKVYLRSLRVFDDSARRDGEDVLSFIERVVENGDPEQDGKDWVSIYQSYVRVNNSGSVEELQLEVF